MAFQHTTPDKPSHDTGTIKGEELAKSLPQRITRKADDASSINLDNRRPIDPRMPHLPPA